MITLILIVGALVAFIVGIVRSRGTDTTSWGLALLTFAYLIGRGFH